MQRHSNSGQVVTLVPLMLVALLGLSAFVIDIGYAYWVQRSLQSSADAAALSGAQELPNPDASVAVARQYSGSSGAKNRREPFPPVATTATAKCLPDAPCQPVNAVEVTETAHVATLFARVLGIDSYDVSARAVALLRSAGYPWAIFAYDSDCGSLVLKMNGNDFTVEGAVRSNGSFQVNGNDIMVRYASSGGPNACDSEINGSNITFAGEKEPVLDTRLHDWPAYFTEGDFSCTYSKDKFTFNENNQEIPPGVYCASETFEANGDGQSGQITVLAPEIKIDGNGHSFTPYSNGVLFFATGTKELILDGDGYSSDGIIFHPRGRIKINGNSGAVFNGLIEGLEVEINGDDFTVVGSGAGGTPKIISLVE